MSEVHDARAERVRNRRMQQDMNVFSRLPAVYAASRAQAQRFLQGAGGLSIVEWRTLWDLHEVGPMTIRDLSSIQRADHSLLSRALPEMQRKGYVTMYRDEEDRRQTIVELAPAGRAAYRKAAPIMRRRREALREAFTRDEIDAIAGYLDRLETFLRIPAEVILSKEPVE